MYLRDVARIDNIRRQNFYISKYYIKEAKKTHTTTTSSNSSFKKRRTQTHTFKIDGRRNSKKQKTHQIEKPKRTNVYEEKNESHFKYEMFFFVLRLLQLCIYIKLYLLSHIASITLRQTLNILPLLLSIRCWPLFSLSLSSISSWLAWLLLLDESCNCKIA